MKVSPTQIRYLQAMASEPGPIPAQVLFDRLRFSKLSLGQMAEAGAVAKEMIDGRSHYRLTQAGIDAIGLQP